MATKGCLFDGGDNLKIKKNLPTMMSLSSLCCGFVSILCAVQGRYDLAAWLIILSMVFDTLDGKLARLTKTSSDFGCQLDSLVDVVVFGVSPAILVGIIFKDVYPILIWLMCFCFLSCSALRLARFNVQSSLEKKPCIYFNGLPTTIAGGTIAQLVLLNNYLNNNFGITTVETIIPSVIFILGILMISKIEFFNIMSKIGVKQGIFPFGLEVVFAAILFIINPIITLSVSLSAYIIVCGLLGLKKEILSRRERNIRYLRH